MSGQGPPGVARVVAEMVKDKSELDTPLAAQVAGAIAKRFGVRPDEVAVFRVGGGGMQLEFIVPEKLAQVGTIPLTSVTSLAVRTLRERRPEIVNNFSTAMHLRVFEGVPLSVEGSEPIQKILSVPIVVAGKAAGVIQVSRKGKSPGAAGPDFTPKDVDELNQVAAALASCFPPD